MLWRLTKRVLLGDSRKCQTPRASPAKPGGLLTALADIGHCTVALLQRQNYSSSLNIFAVIAFGDAIAGLTIPLIDADRRLPGSLPLGVDFDIALRFAVESRHAIRADVYDSHPPQVTVSGLPQTISVPATVRITLEKA